MSDRYSSKGFVAYLLFTAVLCGALVMVLEVLGSRVLGPFFGVSLFVWTSLIAVTMISLAAGYGIGGLLSDRWDRPDHLYWIILAGGVAVLFIPLLKAPVLKLCFSLGLRGGAFVSAMILFGPPLFLLGCVSPYLVKIVARELRNIGRIVGGLYALSTFGSIVGTVLTGFVLIAYLGVDNIFRLIGVLLIGVALGYFLIFQRRWSVLLVLLVPLLASYRSPVASPVMPDGTRVTQVHGEDSYYGSLKVVDYRFRDRHTRELIIDGLVQGGIDMRNGLSIYAYSYFLQFLPYQLNPGGKTCLVVGLGAGILPRWYRGRGVRTDVVDIDPAVVDIARNYFAFATDGDTVIADARYYFISTSKRYDYILLDVFNGDITPGHIVSLEALRLVRARLAPEGVLGINLVGSLKGRTFMTASIIKTLRAVFDQVEIYPTFDPAVGDGIGNLAVVAYQGSPRSFDPGAAAKMTVHPWLREAFLRNIGRRFRFAADTPAMLLTDDYNPIDFYDGWLREKVRRQILETTNWDILIRSAS